MQFFWKHLHNNKGDENVSKLIWIVIAFVIGALLLSTMSVAFRTDGTGTIKSCTKKVKLEFASDLLNKLTNLTSDKVTSLDDDILNYRQLAMIATRYDLKRDTVNPNYIHEKELYTIHLGLKEINRYLLMD